MTVIENVQDLTIERFWETIPPLWNMVRAHIRALATADFDITVEQFHVLRYARRGAGSMSELARAKSISRPAISQGVDGLVEKGLIARQQNADDRRFVNLALTPSGDELLNKIFQENRAWMAEKMAALSAEELNSAIAALEILKRTFEEPTE